MLVRCTAPFAYTDVHGNQSVVGPNDLYEDDDPVVLDHPDMFTPVRATAGRGGVEQASAAPGELRAGVRRAR